MKRMFIISLLSLLFSSCNGQEGLRLEDVECFTLTAKDIDLTYNWGLPINITEFIGADEFDRIIEFILENGHTHVHGALFGFLPSYSFDAATAWLIPRWEFWASWEAQEESAWSNSYNFDEIDIAFDDSWPIRYSISRETGSFDNPTVNIILSASSATPGREIIHEQLLNQFKYLFVEKIRDRIYP